MNKKDDGVCPTVLARKAMDKIWNSSHMKGRTWGPKGKKGLFRGTNILVARGKELVSVCLDKKTRRLIVHQFVLAEKTKLGAQVKRTLTKAGLGML